MDHLVNPNNPIHDPIEVPCLSTEEYDGLDFDAYPTRQGWGSRTVKEWRTIFANRPPEFLAFLQTWLFFRVMELVLGKHIQLSDFTREDSNSGHKVVTMVKFLPVLRKWLVSTTTH